MDADSIRGIPVALSPLAPFIPSPGPSGDTCDDIGLFLDPATGTLNFKKTNFACGPSALAENMGLVGSQDNFLVSSPGVDGMRGGLAAYIPKGVWNVYGTVLVAAKSGVQYVVRVWQGHSESTTRPGIVSENSAVVGGGCNTWPGGDYQVFEIHFAAHMLQFTGDAPLANEITVSIFPQCVGGAGAALSSVSSGAMGGLPNNFASNFMIYRVRGC